jgi:hypothetical protein
MCVIINDIILASLQHLVVHFGWREKEFIGVHFGWREKDNLVDTVFVHFGWREKVIWLTGWLSLWLEIKGSLVDRKGSLVDRLVVTLVGGRRKGFIG